MGTDTDGLSPLYGRGPHGARTLDGAAGISGGPRSVAARDCDDGSCGRRRRGRPTAHWGGLRSPDGQWTEWCGRHGLLGEYADTATVGGRPIFGPEGAEMSRAGGRPGGSRAETGRSMATAVSGGQVRLRHAFRAPGRGAGAGPHAVRLHMPRLPAARPPFCAAGQHGRRRMARSNAGRRRAARLPASCRKAAGAPPGHGVQ